ncbi:MULTISPECIES: methionine ABC transporter permease [Schaalia]|uniref:methionine ABC transporter permease n=1 Tax=Schaalia TaxID=2529408 RepID=UPI001F1878A0|nr:methionine ABC transporter permease [Schaalia hyovaginalis]MCI6557963.1 ABC transporter permease [Schaalia hyovaginalis]MCI7512134.1 ABC transporter permease [Schaalia hyovaginalis]MDD7554521.1 ABC transporter permease [Schaalia hyovaginalis]MDY3094404.1 methionine ABC transporter permease [Schaalia hyovaginalis]MDY4491778.1 methionine ABC transporter permease [Schaalia hyovaginalis]
MTAFAQTGLLGAARLTSILPGGVNDPKWLDNPALTKQFVPAIIDTLLMMGFATLFTVLIGLPLGLLLVQTGKNGLTPNRPVYETASAIVNVVRSFPFIIGIVVLIPVTRLIVGTSLGWQATVVPLVLLSVPYFARLVESNILAVDPGKIEAAQMMGASNRQIRWGVQVREAAPVLVQSITTLAITLIGYSAMAGAVGGGGLGQMAINYGYNRWQDDVMISTVIAIIIIVQLVQMIGDMISRLVDHR